MLTGPTSPRYAVGGRQHVARGAHRPRTLAGAALLLAGAGHMGTFLALGAAGLWLAIRGPGAFHSVQALLAGGLYLQLLPAVAFIGIARDGLRHGKAPASLAAAGLSAVSLGLMGTGLVQMAGGAAGFPVLLTLVTACAGVVGLGIVAGGAARLIRDRHESEPLIIVEPTVRPD